MVDKKKIINELKKYNDDLENHLPEMDYDFLDNKSLFSSSESVHDLLPLVTSNLMDLKTEIALMRKNFADSVEGMMLRLIAQEKKNMDMQMDKIFSQLMVEIKGSFAEYIVEISSELNSIKKDFAKSVSANKDFTESVARISKDFLDFKASFADFKVYKNQIMDSFNKVDIDEKIHILNSHISKLDAGFSVMGKEMDDKLLEFGSIAQKLKSDMDSLSLNIADSSKQVESKIDKLNFGIKNIERENTKIEQDIKTVYEKRKKEVDLERKALPFESKQEKIKINNAISDLSVMDDDDYKPSDIISKIQVASEIKSTDKIIDIEQRIKRLEGLK